MAATEPIPKIVYAGGTLIPTYPNIQKPYMDDFEAVRHDSFSSSGIRQSMLERIDRVKPVTMEFVPWADLPAWQAFFAYAMTGGSFSYYPDSTLTAFATYEVVEDKIKPQFVCIGFSKFTFNMRLIPGGASSL